MQHLPHVVKVGISRPKHPGDSVMGSFVEPEYVFHYIKAGDWTFRMGAHLYEIHEGDLVLLPPGLLHVVTPLSLEDQEHLVVFFELFDAPRELLRAPLVVRADARTGRLVKRNFSILFEEYNSQRPFRSIRMDALMADCLCLYLRNCGRETEPIVAPLPLWPQIERVLWMIQRKYMDTSLGQEAMARSAGLSCSHFSRIFRKYTGVSPYQYLSRVRIEHAQNLLLSGELNCSEVARKTGFESVHVFSKAFRRLAGISPRRWLERTVI